VGQRAARLDGTNSINRIFKRRPYRVVEEERGLCMHLYQGYLPGLTAMLIGRSIRVWCRRRRRRRKGFTGHGTGRIRAGVLREGSPGGL
jgi:hypothetical protein